MATSVIGALRAELSAGVAKFADDMNQAGKQVEKFSKRFRKVGANVSRTGADMSMRMSAPIVAFGGLALKAAGDFEQGMNRVQAVSGATGGQLDTLREQAKEMGRTTQFSASQAADAMGFLAMAGFEVDEIIGALPGTLQLAAAAQMDLGSAADIVSNILSGYGMEVEELSRVNDVLAKTMSSTNTDLTQLGEALKYAGPVASAAGVQFEEAAAAVGLMGNAGIQASMAGTSLRGAISKILNPTAAATKAMEEAGVSFTDAQGKLLPLADIIEQLEPHAENAGLFMELFGQRAGPAMAALVSQGSESLRGLTGELQNAGGTAEKIAAAQMKGFNGAMRELRSAFEGLQIAIADAGLLQAMTDLIKRLAEWTRNLAESNPQMLKWGAIIAGVAAALGPLVFAIGATISGIGGLLKGVALFVKAGPAFIAMAKGIGAAVSLMGGPITLLITALGALAVAWVTHGEEIQAFVSQWIERLDAALGGRLSAIINGVVAVVRWFVQQFRFSFKAIGQLLTGDFAGAWATFKQGWANGWNAIVGIVGTAVGKIGEWIKEKLAAIFDWLGGKIEAVKGYFADLYQSVVGGSYIPDMVDGILREMGRLEDGFVKPADEATKKVGQSFGSLKDQVKNVFQEILDTGEVSTQSLLKLAASAAAQIFDIQGLFKGSPGGGGDSSGQILGTIFSAAFGGGGGFGGFMADGGLAMAGRPYIVGERGPELFRPHTSGTVEPNTGGAGGVTQVFNIQTPDANSFRRSERQIMRSARQKLQM